MLPPVQLIPPNFQNNRSSEQGGYRQTACTCEFSLENSFFYCALSRTPCRSFFAARRVQTLRACTCEFSLENSSFYCALSRTPCGKEGTDTSCLYLRVFSRKLVFYCALSRTPCRSFFAARIGGAAGLSTGASERSERVKRMSGSEPRIAWFLCRLAGTKSRPKEKKNGELNEIL